VTPFDWSAFRTVAERLKDEADEASWRSAISRAYYCAYHQAQTHLSEHHNFQASEDKPAHDQVWREFSRKGMSYREVWNKGDKLKKLRVDADYRSDVVISADTTITSLKLADRIIECLHQIHQKILSGQP
jgi:uncharacterized protein (UPF0332 family)